MDRNALALALARTKEWRDNALAKQSEFANRLAPQGLPANLLRNALMMAQGGMGGRQAALDTAAVGLGGVPGAGDLAGALADANRFATDPSSRTPANFGLSALGLLPLVPGIVKPTQAKQLNTKLQLPDAPEFNAAVANTPGAEITADGLKLRVARKQSFEQDDADSVRTGVFYLPEGDKNMRYYAKGGTAGNYYGGEQSFSGETLLARPLFVKGATGGKAPEAAYDTLMGKGAAKKLGAEAFSVTRDYMARRDPALFREQVAKFLAERGGDPSMADYIIENSKKGNQLRYALQEHVIAHAVRKAGYDGVLGYTSTKTGPRISELFDTREVTYPSEFSEPTIHLDYRPK